MRFFIILLTSLLLSLGFNALASAADPAQTALIDAGRRLIPANMVMIGVRQYYKVYGHWPQNWQAVRSAGIIQVELAVPGEGLVNPDDPSLDFMNDVYYAGGENDGRALVVSKTDPENPVERLYLDPPKTYSLRFAPGETPPFGDNEYEMSSFLGDTNRLLQFAVAGALDDCFTNYAAHHGRGPASIEEFMSSGWSPLTMSSINPMTGNAFKLDGSSNDLAINSLSDTEGMVPHCRPVLADGTMCYGLGIY